MIIFFLKNIFFHLFFVVDTCFFSYFCKLFYICTCKKVVWLFVLCSIFERIKVIFWVIDAISIDLTHAMKKKIYFDWFNDRLWFECIQPEDWGEIGLSLSWLSNFLGWLCLVLCLLTLLIQTPQVVVLQSFILSLSLLIIPHAWTWTCCFFIWS